MIILKAFLRKKKIKIVVYALLLKKKLWLEHGLTNSQKDCGNPKSQDPNWNWTGVKYITIYRVLQDGVEKR